jgi:hypothetical protein
MHPSHPCYEAVEIWCDVMSLSFIYIFIYYNISCAFKEYLHDGEAHDAVLELHDREATASSLLLNISIHLQYYDCAYWVSCSQYISLFLFFSFLFSHLFLCITASFKGLLISITACKSWKLPTTNDRILCFSLYSVAYNINHIVCFLY